MKVDGYNMLFKIMWLILSFIELYIICKCIPNKKIKVISNIGANTLNIYLVHSLILKWVNKYSFLLFCYTEVINMIIMLIITCGILLICENKFIKNAMIYLTDFNKVKKQILKVKN